jgi:peptide/nickel transport system ATP-binding protein
VRDLDIAYSTKGTTVLAVRDAALEIRPGEALALVGESGSGKSTIAYALMRYLPDNGAVMRGQMLFSNTELLTLSPDELLNLRGQRIALVPQNPQTSLNPNHRIGDQIAEIFRIHLKLPAPQAHHRALQMLETVHLPDPEFFARKYPHQISGGQAQRVLIAMAFAIHPDLLVMDEPTTGLDPTTEAHILDLIREMRQRYQTAILYITHNLGVVRDLCDRLAVIYAGQILESGPVDAVFDAPAHPYTAALLKCVPKLSAANTQARLASIEGFLPDLSEPSSGCVFAPRCDFVQDRCRTQTPPLQAIGTDTELASADRHSKCFFPDFKKDADPATTSQPPTIEAATLLTIDHLSKTYPTKKGALRAVDDISFTCRQGEILGIVGESGCGKSTLARCIVGLEDISAGNIHFKGEPLGNITQRKTALRRRIQMVFQNPDATLNPKKTVEQILLRPLTLHNLGPPPQRRAKAVELLQSVNLEQRYLTRYPHQLSGGEKQRVSIARALATQPELLVCDEPVSALDVSVQAGIINLLIDLRQQYGTAFIVIGHDLGVMHHLCDRILVLYMGRICQLSPSGKFTQAPYHPYTEALLASVPQVDAPPVEHRIRLEGNVPSPIDPMPGCAFHSRCPRQLGSLCAQSPPPQRHAAPDHQIACHIPLAELNEIPSFFTGPS